MIANQRPPCGRCALTRHLSKLPADLRRTLTLGPGIKEMTEHAQFTIDTKIAVFFCDPHSPWQRRRNENSNGLLRQYCPKTADLSVYTRSELNAVPASSIIDLDKRWDG